MAKKRKKQASPRKKVVKQPRRKALAVCEMCGSPMTFPTSYLMWLSYAPAGTVPQWRYAHAVCYDEGVLPTPSCQLGPFRLAGRFKGPSDMNY